VVVLVRISDTEAQYHFIDEERLRQIEVQASKVLACPKNQLVNTGDKGVGIKDRIIQSPVSIGAVATELLTFRGYPVKHDFNASSWTAVRGIQNMRC
jgi:hypothetical protein